MIYYLIDIGKGTLPWAIFRFRVFSNYFSQKLDNIKITICINIITYEKGFWKNLTFAKVWPKAEVEDPDFGISINTK